MSKRGLGRGLGALLSATPSESDSLVEVALDAIEPNPFQPRKTIDSNGLKELEASIRASGVIQPIVVRRSPTGYQLIAGERRWRAAQLAGLAKIPAVVREVSDAGSLELALVENILREDLNPLEQAEAYQRLILEFGWTQEELAQRVGRDRSSIANSLRLLKLPAQIQEDLRRGALTMGHARALLALDSTDAQLKLREEILANAWSVRATEEGVQKRVTRQASRPARRRSPELTAVEDSLRQALMTRVRIVGSERHGRIEIVYASREELDRLVDLLGARR
jgi:ParB family chromosome partitioning protein